MLTESELERRRKFITATDAAKLLGVSPFGNAADVYWSKVSRSISESTAATTAGNLLEPVVLAWAQERLGVVLAGDWRVHENGINAASLDGITASGEPVEAKTSGITGPGNPSEWGAEGTDEIPAQYVVQVQAQMLVTGAPRAFVPALLGNRGFVLYVVHANQKLQEIIAEISLKFWSSHVQTQTAPTDLIPRLDTVRALIRTPGAKATLPDELAQRYLEACEAKSAASKQCDLAQAALLAALGDAEIGEWSGGSFVFREQTRKGYSVSDSTFRVLRHSKGKQ